MNQKTINTIFVIVFIILLLIIGFLFLENKNKNNKEENLINSQNLIQNKNESEQKVTNDIIQNKTNENEIKQNVTDNSVSINTAGSYKFEYSKDWKVELNGSTAEINGGKFAALGIINTSLANSTEKYINYLLNKKTNIVNKENVTINGFSALKTEISQDGLYYFIEHNSKVYFIHLMDNYSASDLEKFNIILNSFQFIN